MTIIVLGLITLNLITSLLAYRQGQSIGWLKGYRAGRQVTRAEARAKTLGQNQC